MTKIEIDKKVSKWLDKLEKHDITMLKKIDVFLDNLVRENDEIFIIQIIKIAHRQEAYD